MTPDAVVTRCAAPDPGDGTLTDLGMIRRCDELLDLLARRRVPRSLIASDPAVALLSVLAADVDGPAAGRAATRRLLAPGPRPVTTAALVVGALGMLLLAVAAAGTTGLVAASLLARLTRLGAGPRLPGPPPRRALARSGGHRQGHAGRLRMAAPARRQNGLVIEVEPERFEEMVADALDGLPAELGQLMRNVAVTVEHRPGPPGLLGLYTGVPLTSRTTQYAGVLPDRITIYRLAVCAVCDTEDQLAAETRRVVVHEVGHHFGISDERLAELGW